MKHCKSCDTERPESEFSWRNKAKGTRQSRCKDCFRRLENEKYRVSETERARKKRNRKRAFVDRRMFIWNYLKEHPCVHCGETDPVVLEFDHLSDKVYNIADMKHSFSEARVLEEISKCQVLCANCHRRKTAVERNYYSWV